MSIARLIIRIKEGMSAARESQAQQAQDPLPLATAAVLLEIGHADGALTAAEDGDIVGYLTGKFALDEESAHELIKAADEIRNKTIDHWALTNFIRKNSSLGERIDIVKTMWRMAYADGKLSDYENYLVRKLADLLGIEHHVMIDAKVSVLRELRLATE